MIERTSPKLFAVAVGGTTSLPHAHSGAKGAMKERMDLMKGMADAMKIMGCHVQG